MRSEKRGVTIDGDAVEEAYFEGEDPEFYFRHGESEIRQSSGESLAMTGMIAS